MYNKLVLTMMRLWPGADVERVMGLLVCAERA